MQSLSKCQLHMSSRELAELTNKRHADIKRDCNCIFKELNLDVSTFAHIYKDSQNRRQTEYILNKQLILILVTGYSIKLRAAVIAKLEELEEEKYFLINYLNELTRKYDKFDCDLSKAARFLVVGGKQIKPKMLKELNLINKQIQPDLFAIESDIKGA